MRFQRAGLVSILLIALTGCSGGGQGDEPTQNRAKDVTPAQTPMPSPQPGPDSEKRDVIVRHMHLHAAQLDELYQALNAGDLEAVGKPAYWLSRHETLDGLPNGGRPYLATMQTAALAVEAAPDLTSAKAAADRIAASCRGCHEANDVKAELPTG